jgi:hypothetical protein
MFNSGILDVVIGLVVIYLQLSLVCTAVNELIASFFKKRGKELARGIGTLLTDQQLVDKFYAHPLIAGLSPDGRLPSYIPARTFAMALIDIVRRHSFDGTLAEATKKVAAAQAAEADAQAKFNEATSQLNKAIAVRQAADRAAAAAVDAGDKAVTTRNAGEAATEETKAKAALTDADTKLKAAQQALAAAQTNQTTVRNSTNAAIRGEDDAQTAEAAAKANPKDETLRRAAATARESANTAAENLAPNAAGLLAEARDRVVGAQPNVVPSELKTALLALMDHAGTNLNKAQANLEQWFNDAMDRVSGVYKRKSQAWVLVIAILVTVFANVDSLQIADSLSRDKALRESLIAAVPELAKADRDAVDRERGTPQPTPTPVTSPSPLATPTKPAGAGANQGQSPTPTPTPAPSPSPAETPSLRNVTASLDEIKKLGVPLGYIRVCTPGEEKRLVDNCPSAIDAAVMDSKEALKKAQEDLDKANAKLQEAAAAKTTFETAQTVFETAQKSLDAATAKAGPVGIADATVKAKTAELEVARTSRDKAQAELEKTNGDKDAVEATQILAAAQAKGAKEAHDQAVKAAVAAKQTEAAAVTAEARAQSLRAEAKTHPTAANEKSADDAEAAAANARRKADDQKEEQRIECPKCRKESELASSEMKQRLPTTHGYRLASWDMLSALGAIVSDCRDLLYSHWLGWLLTALAISLGAPFWFDTLNRLMVIRSTVKPHEKSKEQESKDNPDENTEKTKN